MNLAVKQAKLAKRLFQIDDAKLLDEITLLVEQTIAGYQKKPRQKYSEDHLALRDVSLLSIPHHIPLEELAKEQAYDSKKFGKAINKIDYHLFEDETLEEMLNTLSA